MSSERSPDRRGQPAWLSRRLVREDDLTEGEHRAIRELLVSSFPENATAFSATSYLGARPEYRLWLEDTQGEILAHLDFERRLVGVGADEVLVAGIGEVAVRPDLQGRGLGRALMQELRRVLAVDTPAQFGLLYCLEEVAGFYARTGWHRVYQPTRSADPHSGEVYEEIETTFVLPGTEPLERWPGVGTIDLRGEGW